MSERGKPTRTEINKNGLDSLTNKVSSPMKVIATTKQKLAMQLLETVIPNLCRGNTITKINP